MTCKKTEYLRAVQILLDHMKLESTVRYLGIDIDDALEIEEQLDALSAGVSQLSSQDHPTHPTQSENSDHPMLR
jgi:hypothetical protein